MTYPQAATQGWHPVATLAQLRTRPLARKLMGKPLVVFATNNGPSVLVDRCPHRNAALSRGRVKDSQIECPYHGWRFGGDGRCTLTPGAAEPARHAAEILPVIVRHGLVFTSLATRPKASPVTPFPMGDDGYDSFLWPVKATRARLLDAIENLLDPAHPHFVHPGIVRSRLTRRPVDVTVRVGLDSAEAIYVENAQAQALMPRMLEGKRTASVGRFFLPATGQVAFENAKGLKLAVTVFFVPEDEETVRPYAHLATPKGIAPAFLKELFLRAFDMVILSQDQKVLRLQAENVARFGGPKYVRGPLDVLFPAIQALAAGETPEPGETQLSLQL